MTGRVRLAGQVVALACVAVLLALLVWKLTHQRHAPPVGSPAPAFSAPVLGGPGVVSLASLRGRPVVLNFWASWCESCKGEAPVLERDWLRYRGRGIQFFGIDDNDLPSDARTFIAAHRLTFPMLDDGPGTVTGTYGISQLPETYVVNSAGTIVAHFAGPITDPAFAARFAAALRRLA